MTIRNITGFTEWIDEYAIMGGKPILEAEFDNVVDDQHFVLDHARQVLGCVFRQKHRSNTTFNTDRTFAMHTHDVCDVDEDSGGTAITTDQIEHKFSALIWCANAGATVECRVTTGAASSNTATVSRTSTSRGWSALSSAFNARSNGVDETFLFELRRSAGTGDVYLAGLAVQSVEL